MTENTKTQFAADAAPTFREKLAREKTVAGWSSPYQSPDSPDSKATATAEKFIRYFMTGMEEMGYMPFTGVEVNFALYGGNGQSYSPLGAEKTVIPQYEANLYRFRDYVKAKNQDARYQASLAIKKQMLVNKGGWNKPYFDPEPDADLQELVPAFEAALDRISDPNTPINDQVVQELISMVELFDEYIAPDLKEAIDRFTEDGMTHTKAGIIPSHGEDEFEGRVYVDSQNIEIATGVADPLATVQRVNRIKDLAYQSTYDYDQTFAGTREDMLGENTTQHSDPLANAVVDAMGDVNIGYSFGKDGSTGEHLSFSLQRNATLGESYGARKHDREQFHEDNLFKHYSNYRLFSDIFTSFLGTETLLSLGNIHDLARFEPDEHGVANAHQVNKDGFVREPHQEGTHRVEFRTFNNASSNVALSMVAVMAVAYAALKELKRHPDIETRMNANETHAGDVETIVDEMVRTYGDGIEVPYTMNQAVARFRDDSLTLEMMREFVDDHVKDGDERQSLYAEIEGFKENVIKRARGLEREQTRETKIGHYP